MVDALNRAHRWLRPDGCLIDLRPTTDLVARVQVGKPEGPWTDVGALIIQNERRLRYAAADRALQAVLDRGVFALASEGTLDFIRYADSPDELRDYIASHWRETHMDAATHARAAARIRQEPGHGVRLMERLVMRRLEKK